MLSGSVVSTRLSKDPPYLNNLDWGILLSMHAGKKKKKVNRVCEKKLLSQNARFMHRKKG